MRRLLVSGLLVCCFCLLFAGPSRAQFVTYTVQGHVTSIDDPLGFYSGLVSVGDQITGTVSLNQSYPNMAQLPIPPFGNVGIFLHLPSVDGKWLEFFYAQGGGVDSVNGFHSIGQWSGPGVDIGSSLELKTGGAVTIDGRETGNDFFLISGVFDHVAVSAPEGDSYVLFGVGLLIPALMVVNTRRRKRKIA